MNNEILTIENLAVGYSKPICSGISAGVQKGDLVGLIGKNGSGKSTLIKSILGLQSSLYGQIQIFGENIGNWDVQRRSKEIAVVFSRLNQTPAISVFDLVALGRLPYKSVFAQLKQSEIELIENALDLVGIMHLKNQLANELSDGQLQMVMIARALVQDTKLVIMDEPTSHLDMENQFKIFELIFKLAKQTEKTFIVASHQVELILQNATQIWWMENGEFHAGFPEKIAFEQKIFEKLSQENIRFDYEKGSFQFKHLKTKKVNLVNDGSDLAYWVKRALERNGFEVSKEGQFKIEIKEHLIYFKNQQFDKIEKLIEYLNE